MIRLAPLALGHSTCQPNFSHSARSRYSSPRAKSLCQRIQALSEQALVGCKVETTSIASSPGAYCSLPLNLERSLKPAVLSARESKQVRQHKRRRSLLCGKVVISCSWDNLQADRNSFAEAVAKAAAHAGQEHTPAVDGADAARLKLLLHHL